MVAIGRYNELKVAGKNRDGLSLSDGEMEVLLPFDEVPADVGINDRLNVFVFVNKAGQLVATTKQAFAEVGDFAYLTVVDAGEDGAFLDLGISKDIYVPIREQRSPMRQGEKHVVYLYMDRLNERILASSRLY